MNKEIVQPTKGQVVNNLYQDTQLFWYIQREWNRSKKETVEMTVEEALKGLNSVIERHPNSPVARNASLLINAIIMKQDDSLFDYESLPYEDSSHLKNHQGTLASS